MAEDIIIWQDGFIKGFKFVPYNPTLEASVLGFYEGKQVQHCIRETPKKASRKSHNYYRGIILPIASQSEQFRGWKLDEIHKYFTSKYLKDVIHRKIGDTDVLIVTTESTGDVNNKRMTAFIEDVKQELSEMGIVVPEPIIRQ